MRAKLLGLLSVALVGCGSNNLASNFVKPPDFDPTDMTKCKVRKSQNKPLIVEWPSAERGELEATAKKGLVVVRYLGCELELLTLCTAPGGYGYTAYTPKKDTLSIKNEDELYANIPIGAAKFEAKLATAGELGVQMTLVGRYLADNDVVHPDELKGSCDGATHIIAGLTVGAFEFFAGAQAGVGAGAGVIGATAGAESKSKHETLTQDGNAAACQAGGGKEAPPKDCGALIRIEVVPLATTATASARPVSGSTSAEMVLVPAGPFWMGCAPADNDCREDEKPRHEVYLDAFYIDKTEVTMAEYRRCVNAKACKAPRTGVSCNWPKLSRNTHPVNCVNWKKANTYCKWVDKRLPTEAQWEKAARGTDSRIFPWGDQAASCSYAIMRDNDENGCGRDLTRPVGSKPTGASPYGALDMAGNVQEWVADHYVESYYKHSPHRNPPGPIGMPDRTWRVHRGGAYSSYDGAVDLRASSRDANNSGDWSQGFRCARPAK